jgi:two-component system response regulator DevR
MAGSVVVVDAQALFRQGVASLAEQAGLTVVGQAASGAEALRLVASLHPDLVVMDTQLPDSAPFDLCRDIIAASEGVAVVVLTTDASGDTVRLMAEAGARGYLLKDIDFADLRRAFEQVLAGETVLHPQATARLLETLAVARASRGQGRLTSRQIAILSLASEGLTNREIARRVHLSHHTVKEYMSSAMRKLGVASRVEAVLAAERLGLLGPRGEVSEGGRTADTTGAEPRRERTAS